MAHGLHEGFLLAASAHASSHALLELGGSRIDYRGLNLLAQRLQGVLAIRGVGPGDRVAVALPKSIDAVVAILAILRRGAAYVPLDADTPAHRIAGILTDADVKAFIVQAQTSAHESLRLTSRRLEALPIDAEPGGRGIAKYAEHAPSESGLAPIDVHDSALAYLLYTSGSTGIPKGVATSHGSGRAFIDWFVQTFSPGPADVFASHVSFSFSMSISDLFAPPRVGASVLLLDNDAIRDPPRLAAAIGAHQVTCWFSTPSALRSLEEFGRLERHRCEALRLVLFAGEPYPIEHLKRLRAAWPSPRLINIMGSTETSMRCMYVVPDDIVESNESRLPIGRLVNNYSGRVVDGDLDVAPGVVGELLVSGPALMDGYWRRDDLNTLTWSQDHTGNRWFRTGDLVATGLDGHMQFHGRRDRLVKRRGYRIELGEVETVIAKHEAVSSVAAVARTTNEETRVVAYVVPRTGGTLSPVKVKQFCAHEAPLYMVPDRVVVLDEMPQTPNGKIDYLRLATDAAK